MCGDIWTIDNTQVVCLQLGYQFALDFKLNAYYGEGTGRIWMDAVQCIGSESNIDRCYFSGWGQNDCSHSEDVGVVCGKFFGIYICSTYWNTGLVDSVVSIRVVLYCYCRWSP